MGNALVGFTKRAFNDAVLRAAPWSAKRDGTPSRLKQSGSLGTLKGGHRAGCFAATLRRGIQVRRPARWPAIA
jgi:hypothetical protein